MAHQRVMIGDYALSGLVGYQMAGKTIGIMGTGAIGVEAVRIFKVGAVVDKYECLVWLYLVAVYLSQQTLLLQTC